jgi:ABC-type Fe3+-siderophore transport system permease subunit
VGRVAFSPTELSSGILLNLIGAPFFLAILIFGKRRGEE